MLLIKPLPLKFRDVLHRTPYPVRSLNAMSKLYKPGLESRDTVCRRAVLFTCVTNISGEKTGFFPFGVPITIQPVSAPNDQWQFFLHYSAVMVRSMSLVETSDRFSEAFFLITPIIPLEVMVSALMLKFFLLLLLL